MNQIQQSLSTLLQNPALQSEANPRRATSGSGESASAPVAGGESLEISGGARQALAQANAEASMPVIGNLAEARELTQVLRESLRNGEGNPWNAHRGVDVRTASSLLR